MSLLTRIWELNNDLYKINALLKKKDYSSASFCHKSQLSFSVQLLGPTYPS